jgi:hypothetical protein
VKQLRKAWIRPKADFVSVAFEPADVSAFQALHKGEANADQQKRALDWVINKGAGFYELSFSENERDTNFSEGRRFVGKQIVNMLSLNISTLLRRTEK